MTPDLMMEGTERLTKMQTQQKPNSKTESGDRQAAFSRVLDPEQLDMTHGQILYLEDVSVSFDGFKAINQLSLQIAKNELRCIIGPNGAGKTTMMDIITGKTRPDTGVVFFGSTIDLLSYKEADIARLGIGRKFQKPTVFENLSVFENLELAIQCNKNVWSSFRFVLNGEQKTQLEKIVETIHLKDRLHDVSGLLSHGQKQWLEIGMLLAQSPQLILLDEPVAGMTDHETERTAQLCLELKKSHSLVVVEHDMGFVHSIADKVTVLHEGSVLAEGSFAQVQANPQVVEVYLGR